ncbi:hypothetical protein TNCV_4524301 [Trichonephila clavipes]|nr:hypothetical protein TNCV_4524301 [Trichonephila clavipes]
MRLHRKDKVRGEITDQRAIFQCSRKGPKLMSSEPSHNSDNFFRRAIFGKSITGISTHNVLVTSRNDTFSLDNQFKVMSFLERRAVERRRLTIPEERKGVP